MYNIGYKAVESGSFYVLAVKVTWHREARDTLLSPYSHSTLVTMWSLLLSGCDHHLLSFDYDLPDIQHQQEHQADDSRDAGDQ